MFISTALMLRKVLFLFIITSALIVSITAEAVASPQITSPTSGSTLTGSSQIFTWQDNGTSVTEWWLYVGTSAGARDIYDSGTLALATSDTVSNLPIDGSTLFVRLWYRENGAWKSVDTTYIADDSSNVMIPAITSPVAGTTLSGTSQTFTWQDNGTSVTEWWLYVGTSAGALDIYNSGTLGLSTSDTVNNLPTDGSTLFVRLWYKENGAWKSVDTTYVADDSSNVMIPAITSPVAGATLSGTSQTFTWQDNETNVSEWWLYVGTSAGAKDIYDSGTLALATSDTVNNLPTNGSTLFVRLWYKENGAWKLVDSTYVADDSGNVMIPAITSPVAGATLSGTSQTFTWQDNGTNVSEWWLYVGTSAGANDIYDSGTLALVTSDTVSNLPTNGSTLFVRLWYRVGSTWGSTDVTYTASNAVDTIPPVISLSGASPYKVTLGSGTYIDPGVTALDNVDGVVNVTIDASQVNMNVVGNYIVTFTATDTAGNSSSDSRVVNVEAPTFLNGLTGYWSLNENTGLVAQDQSTNGLHLNLNNMTNGNWVTGQAGSALEFDGANEDVSMLSGAAPLQTPSITISAWVYPDTSTAFWEWIAAQGDNVGIYLSPGERKVNFYMKDTSGIWISVSSAANSFEFNKWQHIVGSFDAATHTLKVYVDGTEVGNLNAAQGIQYDAGNGFTIGSMQGSRLFDGRIDEVQVYDTALTKAEINQIGWSIQPLTPSPVVKILPLGDSITDSFNGRPSYRRQLWQLLNDAGYSVDFVGNSTNSGSQTDYDLDHEGHSGFEAGDIDQNLNTYLSTIDPDIVLLHIGTNDLDRGQSDASTLTEIDSIIQKLRVKNPQMVILLAKIIPMQNYDTASFNAQIDSFVATRTTTSSPIIVVDQYTGYDAQVDNYDNYHPGETGENKIAGKWFLALQSYLAGQVANHTTTKVPGIYSDALRNPMKGFRWTFKNQQYQTFFPLDRPYLSLGKWYIAYDLLENDVNDDVQKIIDYSNTLWSALPEGNYKVVPRVYLQFGSSNAEYRWPADMTDGDFSSQQYYNRVGAFIAKLGQAWDNDPRVAFVEMGILGAWGEHHTPYPTPQMETFMGDAFTAAFKNKQVLHAGTTDHFQAYPFATYWDSFSHPVEELFINWLEANRPDSWKSRAYIGEVAYNWGGIENYLGTDPTDNLSTPAYYNRLLNYLRRSHNSSLSWIADYQQTSATEVGADLLQKDMGYRYLLEQVTIPQRVTQQQNFQVSFSVKNEGVAPFYEQWPIELVLLDSQNYQPVWREVFQNAPISSWLPGEGWTFDVNNAHVYGSGYATPAASYTHTGTFNLPNTVPNGEYIVALAVLDPAGMHPSLRFATSNYLNGGFHPIGKLGVNTIPGSYDLTGVSFDDPQDDYSLFYEPAVPPSIIVTSPEGGESWNGGSSQTVIWNSYNAGDFVDIELSLDRGLTWSSLLSNTENDGSETVFVPVNQATTTARVRVKNANAEDISNADFELTDN